MLIYSRMPKLPKDLDRKVTIYDLSRRKILHEVMIENKELVGRLESGIYEFIHGHIYYNNNVIKVRYDLFDQPNSSNFQENEIFDFYFNILPIAEGEKVQADCPFDSKSLHRMLYIIKSTESKSCSRMLIVPYLHEKKIFLHRAKHNTQYFYTSFFQECPSVLKHEIGLEVYNLVNKQKSIMAMNLHESKFYLYSQRGVLRNRINFSSVTKNFGNIINVSPNGRNFILQKKGPKDTKLTIMHLSECEFTRVKTISLAAELESFRKHV